jgi:hypothetical protein
MKKLLMSTIIAAGFLSSPAFAQTCPTGFIWDDCEHTYVGPGPCVPGCIPDPNYTPGDPAGPDKLCIRDKCYSVQYSWIRNCVVADSNIRNGYQVLGTAGPCSSSDRSKCPDIKNQAWNALRNSALNANRAAELAK